MYVVLIPPDSTGGVGGFDFGSAPPAFSVNNAKTIRNL